MDHVHWYGMNGWRWMVLFEGIPALIGGIACYRLLTDTPDEASWLTGDEKRWLAGELARDHAQRDHVRHLGTLKAITDPKVLLLSLIYFVYQAGSLGVGYWMPQIIRKLSATLTNFEIGLLAMVPYAVATVAMVLWSMSSDRTGERQWHSALPLAAAAVALAATGFMTTTAASLAFITVALSGLYAFKSPF